MLRRTSFRLGDVDVSSVLFQRTAKGIAGVVSPVWTGAERYMDLEPVIVVVSMVDAVNWEFGCESSQTVEDVAGEGRPVVQHVVGSRRGHCQ